MSNEYQENSALPSIDGIKFWHRILLPDGTYTPGIVHHGPDGGTWVTDRFGLPAELTGKSVLDIGAWDGFFSFEAEKRGASKVIASDCTEEEGGNWGGTRGFEYAKAALNSKVSFISSRAEELYKHTHLHDLVLYFGIIYHLRSPLQGLEAALGRTKETCLIETAIAPIDFSPTIPALAYQPGYANDPTNFFYPNSAWIIAVCKQNGFSCDCIYIMPGRATYRATRNVPVDMNGNII